MDVEDAWAGAMAGALIGAERAPARAAAAGPVPLPASGDAATDLVGLVAALGAYRLAGAGLAAGLLVPFPPLDPVGPACPAAAAGRLALLLTDGGSAAEPLVREWCGLAAARGLRAPPELWPLLALHASTPAGAATVAPVAGPEILWLGRVVVGRGAAPAAVGVAPAEDWTLGEVPERCRAFAAMRAADPDAARRALEDAFRSEKAEARAALVDAMAEGLGEADEPFLDACLDDRSLTVRGAARRLLLRLPGSRLVDRMAARAAAALRVTTVRRLLGAPRHTLEVALPEASPELARDGIEPPRAAAGDAGPRADLLRQVVAASPLRAFADHPPGLWLRLATEGEWEVPLLAGLFDAARRERDPAWVEASLAWLGERCARRGADAAKDRAAVTALCTLLAPLSPDDWERRVEAVMRSTDVDLALRLLDGSFRTHSPRFTEAVLAWMAGLVRRGGAARDALRDSPAAEMLRFRLDPSEAAAAAAGLLRDAAPEDGDHRLRRSLTILADTLAQRANMRREFDA